MRKENTSLGSGRQSAYSENVFSVYNLKNKALSGVEVT